MRWTELKRAVCTLAVTSALVLSAACGGGGGDKSPTGPQPDPGSGPTAQYTLARIGFISLPADLTFEGCAPTRVTGGGMRFYADGTWDFAIAIENDYGDTRFDNNGRYEQQGGTLRFEAADGETFQGTVDEDGVIAIDYDYCLDGETDIQLVFAR